MNLDLNAYINLACVVVSVCFFVAKLDAMTKSNRQFYETTIANLHENINAKFAYLEGNITEKFRVVDERFTNITDHVHRLERKQEESNQIKERLAVVEHMLKVYVQPNEDYSKVIDALSNIKK